MFNVLLAKMVFSLKNKYVLHNAPMAHLETQLLESVLNAIQLVLLVLV